MKYAVITLVFCALFLIFYIDKRSDNTTQEEISAAIEEEKTDSQEKETDATSLESASKSESANTLILSNQQLTKVPPYVFEETNLTTLDLAGNLLEGALPAEIRQLKNLRVLNLSDNNFTGIPAEVGQLSQLEVLDVSNNPITGLPHEIGNLQNLKVLDLRGTNYSEDDLRFIKSTLPEGIEIEVTIQ